MAKNSSQVSHHSDKGHQSIQHLQVGVVGGVGLNVITNFSTMSYVMVQGPNPSKKTL